MAYHYFVEGDTERKFIEVIKENKYVYSGRIEKRNLLEKKISDNILKNIQKNTDIVIIFDTDVIDINNINILDKNIEIFENNDRIKKVILIPQVKNLEDELIYSTKIKKIKDLLESKSDKDFKRDFISCNNLMKKLEEKEFKISKLWSREATDIYKKYENKSEIIKKKV